ncbi:MAG: amidohydrolase [Gemmatimonadota bacterium]|jgi:amidohydrolase|nr:amidohydrolase [Gemmatimonadota bacterium]
MTDAELELLIATRRDLHQHPELGFEEFRTAGIVADRLRAAGYQLKTGVAGTGVVGTLKGGGGPGGTLLLRADMDALPIVEKTSHNFRSRHPGRMHACGHDAHVAIGIAVAERLAKRADRLPGEIRYVFQPAEEGLGGASRMISEGVLEGVDAALGLHVWSGLPAGEVGVVDGPQMASFQDFTITVTGRGGHAAIPHETVDALYVAAQIVVALQSIVSRNISPLDHAVVTVGSLHAGTASNIIAGSAVLGGTTRGFSSATDSLLRTRVTAVAEGVATALGAQARVEFAELVVPPTTNDPALAALVRQVAIEVIGPEFVRSDPSVRTMAAEDFAEFCTRVPGCFFFVGAAEESIGAVHPHHSPFFDISEKALPVGVEVLERAAVAWLTGSAASASVSE